MTFFTTAGLAALAIVAFAGNSVLTRIALAGTDISPAMFMGVRLISGAAALACICGAKRQPICPSTKDVVGVVALFTYALSFTYAYVAMSAATGALILFGVVQLSLSIFAFHQGNVPRRRDVLGMFVALGGLAWLLFPKASAPPVHAAALMVAAGIAWATYTLEGRKGGDAISRTARNFTGAACLASLWLVASLPAWPDRTGLLLAVMSGVVTSAFGYVLWYAVVPRIGVFTSGALQLLVPGVASLGGLLIGEQLPPELLLASVLIVGGIALTLKPARN